MQLSIHTEMYPHCFKQEAFSGSIGRYVFERIALLYYRIPKQDSIVEKLDSRGNEPSGCEAGIR